MTVLYNPIPENENGFMGWVEQLATVKGWVWWHDLESKKNPAGYPDLHLMRPPQYLIVELKTNKGRVTPEQKAWLAGLRACGIDCRVWRPRDRDEVLDALGGQTAGRGIEIEPIQQGTLDILFPKPRKPRRVRRRW